MYEIFINEKNEIIETGEILFANLKLSGQNNSLELKVQAGVDQNLEYELTFIENANGDISDSRLYLGFNISRAFSLKGKDSNSWWAKDKAFI